MRRVRAGASSGAAHAHRCSDLTYRRQSSIPVVHRACMCPSPANRMLAYRAELDLARQLAPHEQEPETTHEVVDHNLFASEASLVADHQAEILKVRLLHHSHICIEEALKLLRVGLNKIRMVCPGTDLRLLYECVSG